MNREIKFRVWDGEAMEYAPKLGTGSDTTIDGWFDMIRYIDQVPMQYTGLNDKDGQEIYEGDIVNKGLGEIFWDTKSAMFKIRWHNKTWKDVRSGNPSYKGGEALFANHDIVWVVIGNIYQNPELLKGRRRE